MHDMVCNLCGSDDFTVVFAAGKAQKSRIVKCAQCNLMYANPRIHELDHQAVSRADPAYLEEMLIRRHDARMDKERLQVRDYRSTKMTLASLCPRRGALLEIGSGLGFLLEYFAADGWDVTGLDPNPLCCQHARKTLGQNALVGTLETASLPESQFEVAMLMHVIEHVSDPMQTLKTLGRLLKPGGILVLETPRYDTLSFRLLRHRERSISCDGHVYFFCSPTLRRLTEQAGYVVLKRELVGRSMTVDRMFWNLGVIAKSEWAKRAVEFLSRALRLDRVSLRVNIRDMERLYLVNQRTS